MFPNCDCQSLLKISWKLLLSRGHIGILPSIVENQMEKNMGHEMETGISEVWLSI